MADETVENAIEVYKRKKRQKNEKNPKRPKICPKKKPGFDENIYKETEYFIKDGLRYVKPYPFTFTTYCKGRWLRRKLIDVLAQEFQSETVEYYSKAIKNGKITVNGNAATEDLILRDNDILSHKVHRHEPPVTAEPITIIKESEDLVVVNKPSSIPIHPCGRYRHNTLVFLLGREFGLTNLYTIHRIDRLTSGIVMFSKSLAKAQELEKLLRERKLHKEYVCKVRGEFPSDVIECNQPIAVVSHKVGVCRVDPGGKLCKTVFNRVKYDGTNSIVNCQPFTGRMHQIRVHLQWLGYPIVDDPIYNHEAWGPDRGSGGVEDDRAWKVIESIATSLRNNDNGVDLKLNNASRDEAVSKTEHSDETLKTCDEIKEICSKTTREELSNQQQLKTEEATSSDLQDKQDKPCDLQEGRNFQKIQPCSETTLEIQPEDQKLTVEQALPCVSTGLNVKPEETGDEWKQENTPDEIEKQPNSTKLIVKQPITKGPKELDRGMSVFDEWKQDTQQCRETTTKKQPNPLNLTSITRKDPEDKGISICDEWQQLESTLDEIHQCNETTMEKQPNSPNRTIKQPIRKDPKDKGISIFDERQQESTLDENETTMEKQPNSPNLTIKQPMRKDPKDKGISVFDEWKREKDPDCTECQIQRRDPSPDELNMCLHAALYKGPDWEFRCPWPAWASP